MIGSILHWSWYDGTFVNVGKWVNIGQITLMLCLVLVLVLVLALMFIGVCDGVRQSATTTGAGAGAGAGRGLLCFLASAGMLN